MGLILASASPRRAELLKDIVKDFQIIPSDIDEKHNAISNGLISDSELCMNLAHKKALNVFERYGQQVLGADTLVFSEGKIIGKPRSRNDAFEILHLLSRLTHKVITGLALIDQYGEIMDFDISYVSFGNISDNQIWDYIDKYQPFDKAGAYGLQEIINIWDVKYDGSYSNVLGLPIEKVKNMLKLRRENSVKN